MRYARNWDLAQLPLTKFRQVPHLATMSSEIFFSSQFSLVDLRPLHGMSDLCKKHNIKLVTYGTLVSETRRMLLQIAHLDQ